MKWVCKEFVGSCKFHHVAKVHDRDSVREVFDGNIGNYPICFRVLDTDQPTGGSGSLLLDANYGLIRKVYDSVRSRDWFAAYLEGPDRSLQADVKLFIRIFEEEFVEANPKTALDTSIGIIEALGSESIVYCELDPNRDSISDSGTRMVLKVDPRISLSSKAGRS